MDTVIFVADFIVYAFVGVFLSDAKCKVICNRQFSVSVPLFNAQKCMQSWVDYLQIEVCYWLQIIWQKM